MPPRQPGHLHLTPPLPGPEHLTFPPFEGENIASAPHPAPCTPSWKTKAPLDAAPDRAVPCAEATPKKGAARNPVPEACGAPPHRSTHLVAARYVHLTPGRTQVAHSALPGDEGAQGTARAGTDVQPHGADLHCVQLVDPGRGSTQMLRLRASGQHVPRADRQDDRVRVTEGHVAGERRPLAAYGQGRVPADEEPPCPARRICTCGAGAEVR